MVPGASVDLLNPQRAHVPLLLPSVSVLVLQGLFNPLSRDPDTILGTPPEALGKL